MRLNTPQSFRRFTHEGGPAFPHLTPLAQLRRSVLSTLLWEDQFYEDGVAIADRIRENAAKVEIRQLAALAYEARAKHNLRHVPLLLLSQLVKHHSGNPAVKFAIRDTIQRVDEMAELLAIYWSDTENKHMIPASLRKGLALALPKFSEYALAKYDRDGKVKLRDVFRLARATPESEWQSALWKRAVKGELATPDTWEVELSRGADKKETFERLIRENKLGYLALLRNLRNMERAGCDPGLVAEAIRARRSGAERVLPFRYIAAFRACPSMTIPLDYALCAVIEAMPSLPGRTNVLVDVSGSMAEKLSAKSDLRRVDAAAALASIVKSDALRVFTFDNRVRGVPPFRGLAGVESIARQVGGGTFLGSAVHVMNKIGYDRLIVISDEQSADPVPDPIAKAYMINVASAKNGIGYGKWTHIDGFSENVIRFIHEIEAERA